MKIKKLENISKNSVVVILSDGTRIKLSPKGILENIEVNDISGVAKWTKVTYDLSEVR